MILGSVCIPPTNLRNNTHQASGASLCLWAPMLTLASVLVFQMAFHKATTTARAKTNTAIPYVRAQTNLFLEATTPPRTLPEANSAILHSSRYLKATTLARVNSAILSSRCLQATTLARVNPTILNSRCLQATTLARVNSAILSSRCLQATTLARVNSAILSSRCLQATTSVRVR